MKHRITIEIISSLLIVLFVYTACSKLLEYRLFRSQLENAPFINKAAPVISWLLPAAELLTAAELTITATRKAGLYSSFFLLLFFTAYIALMLFSNVHLPCTCGGVIKSLSWKQHLVFNIFFLSIAAVGIAIGNKKTNQLPIKYLRKKRE